MSQHTHMPDGYNERWCKNCGISETRQQVTCRLSRAEFARGGGSQDVSVSAFYRRPAETAADQSSSKLTLYLNMQSHISSSPVGPDKTLVRNV